MNGRKLRRGLAWSLLAVVVGAILFHVVAGWTAFGKRPSGERLVRMARSPERRGEVFVNREPLENDLWLSLKDAFAASPHTSPSAPIPLTHAPASRFATPPASGLRLTWLGHSTTLIEIDGRPALRFDGSNDQLVLGRIPATNDFCIVVVARPTRQQAGCS